MIACGCHHVIVILQFLHLLERRWDPTQEAIVFGPSSSGAATDLIGAANETLHGLSNPFANPSHAYTLSGFLTPARRARVVDAPLAGEEWVHFTSEHLLGGDNADQYMRPLSAPWYQLFYFEDYATVRAFTTSIHGGVRKFEKQRDQSFSWSACR